MAIKSKIGGRVPVLFKSMAVTTEEGGAHDEVYVDGPRVFANVVMKNSLRNITDGQLQMTTVYTFSGIRKYEGLNLDKTMLVNYKGLNLAIDSLILDETKVPYYYTITALTNG